MALLPSSSLPSYYNSATKLPAGVVAGPSLPPWVVDIPPTHFAPVTPIPAAAAPALTGQNDPAEEMTDGHQDFSGQTIDYNAINFGHNYVGPPWLIAFGADLGNCHFVGTGDNYFGYGNLDLYNSNLQDSTYDPGFTTGVLPGGGNANQYHTELYNSHFGSTPRDVGVPRGDSVGIPGPRSAWRIPDIQVRR
jgi:hypothetical protein